MDLSAYRWIVVSSSGGKDSQTALRGIVRDCKAQGVPLSRVVVVHCDLGRVEHPGTAALAQRQAEHYGLRFELVSRPQGDLLDHVLAKHAANLLRGLLKRAPWFGPGFLRFCTSDHKRGQVAKLFTRLAKEAGASKANHVRILDVLGLRAAESDNRSKKLAAIAGSGYLESNERASNGLRTVECYYPIAAWSDAEVWADIHASGVEYHEAYDKGFKRLSCAFCFFASRAQHRLAARLYPELLDAYCEVEEKTGFDYQPGYSLRALRSELKHELTVLEVS